MKPTIPILVVTTVALAVTSVQFARQAATQRERAESEKALRQTQDARIAQLERELALAYSATGAAPPASAMKAAASPTGGTKAGLATAASADRVVSSSNSMAPGGNSPAPASSAQPVNMLASEAGRKYMQSMMKASTRRTYADVGSALGLTEDKANQLLELLGEQQARNVVAETSGNGMVFTQTPNSPDRQQKDRAEIAAVIGEDKMGEWAAYQKTLPDRVRASSIDQQLQQAGVPLTDNQRADLRAAITDVSQRLPRPAITPGLPREEVLAQTNQWQADYEAALLDSVKPVLSSRQYAAYKEQMEMQANLRKAMQQQQEQAQAREGK
jgi:hypothetical protein